eukprot:2766360-Pyramimonas_sp.AAC.1
MFFHLDAVLTQPLIATLRAHAGTSPTHWAPAWTPRFAGFPWALVFRLGRATRALVPARDARGNGAGAPRSRTGARSWDHGPSPA